MCVPGDTQVSVLSNWCPTLFFKTQLTITMHLSWSILKSRPDSLRSNRQVHLQTNVRCPALGIEAPGPPGGVSSVTMREASKALLGFPTNAPVWCHPKAEGNTARSCAVDVRIRSGRESVRIHGVQTWPPLADWLGNL